MTYRIWKGHFPGSGFAFAERQEGLSAQQELDIFFGTPLAEPLPQGTITTLSPGTLPDRLESAWSSVMVSARLKAVVERHCPEIIQYIPITLAAHPQTPYWIANLLYEITCFDWERSVFKTYDEPPRALRKVSKMRLKPLPADAPALFRLEEITEVLLVRDDLREALETLGVSGGYFVKVDDYRL